MPKVSASKLPEFITREQFIKWLEGCASEIVAGGCMASDEASRVYNQATFRAQKIVKDYAEGRGLFQLEDLDPDRCESIRAGRS